MKLASNSAVLLAICAVLLLSGLSAHAGVIAFADGRWRLEVTGTAGVHAGKVSREDDLYATASIEYEMPAFHRATFGLRFYPLFWYDEHGDDDDEPDQIHGAAFGVTARLYTKPKKRAGFFVEVGTAALVQDDTFERNSSELNFLSEAGVGYKFSMLPVHVSAKLQHISNAGLGEDNAGVNGVGVGVGFTF